MNRLDRQIRYFLKIAEMSSLSKAAEALNLTQSGLSRQLSALEETLGTSLFIRTGRGVRLSKAGERLDAQIRSHYQQIDAAVEAFVEKSGADEDNLNVAIIHTLSHRFMSGLMARFLSLHNHVNLSVMARSSPSVVDLVERNQADLGFVYDTAVASHALESVPLFDDEMCLVVKKGCTKINNPIDLTDCRLPLIAFPEHYALRKMVKSAGLGDQVVAEANTIDAMLRLVSIGIGHSILPEHVPQRLLAEYDLEKIVISAPILRRRVVAIVRANERTPATVRDLLDMARQVVAT